MQPDQIPQSTPLPQSESQSVTTEPTTITTSIETPPAATPSEKSGESGEAIINATVKSELALNVAESAEELVVESVKEIDDELEEVEKWATQTTNQIQALTTNQNLMMESIASLAGLVTQITHKVVQPFQSQSEGAEDLQSQTLEPLVEPPAQNSQEKSEVKNQSKKAQRAWM
jgi:tetrahydromethanopterin S-methyltransferase subunit B